MNQQYKSLEVDNLKNLAEKQYKHIEPLVENLLPGKGVYLFCGGSKIGKSWLAFDLGLHICSGKKFWKNEEPRYDLSQLKEKKLLSVEEASDLFGIGRGRIREMSNSDRCPFVLWVCGHRRIKREAFEAYLRDQYSV